jgi:hypothetical protein
MTICKTVVDRSKGRRLRRVVAERSFLPRDDRPQHTVGREGYNQCVPWQPIPGDTQVTALVEIPGSTRINQIGHQKSHTKTLPTLRL